MSRVAPPPSPEESRRSAGRLAVVGAALCLPQLAVGWIVLPAGWDVLALILPFVSVAGVLVLAVAATRAWKLRSDRLAPIALAGLVCIVVATALYAAWPPDGYQVLYTGGLFAPPARAVHLTYLFVAVGALWQFGLFVLLGAVGSALTRRRTRAAG